MKKVYIVILNYNGGKTTIDCLKSVTKLKDGKDFEIETVVVDNGSSDNSVEEIRKAYEKITILENPNNLGFSGGCNEGIRYAVKNDADYVVLLNNDTRVDDELIIKLVDAAEEGVAAVVPKIYFEKGFEYHKDKYSEKDLGKVIWYAGGKMDWNNLIGSNVGVDEVDRGQFDKKYATDLATGCCLLLTRQALSSVGLFDDRYFLYYEDADLSERIKKNGFEIIFEPKAIMWHKNAESSGGSGSGLQDYYISRNRLLFGMTYAPLKTRIALVRESMRLLVSGRKWQKKGIADYFKHKFGKGSFKA